MIPRFNARVAACARSIGLSATASPLKGVFRNVVVNADQRSAAVRHRRAAGSRLLRPVAAINHQQGREAGVKLFSSSSASLRPLKGGYIPTSMGEQTVTQAANGSGTRATPTLRKG